jgi:TPR repeat protein
LPTVAPRRAFDLAEPTTQEGLLSAQIQCNRSSPEDCERAAVGLESGSLGVKDLPRARSLRRIALTLYVKQCETGRAIACSRLAEMYEVGDMVQMNPRNAQALRTRVSELCAQHQNAPGCLP